MVTLAGALAIQNFGFTNTTWGGGSTGSGVPELKPFGLDLGPNAGFRGIDGQVIAEGTPEAVRKDPKVIAACLGDDMTDVALSGTTADSPEGIL